MDKIKEIWEVLENCRCCLVSRQSTSLIYKVACFDRGQMGGGRDYRLPAKSFCYNGSSV